jgi:hypothetical protein
MKNNKLLSSLLLGAAIFGCSAMSMAATAEGKATYKTAVDTANADYKAAHAKCDSLSGNGKDVCVEEAKAARDKSKAEAEAQYKNTPKAAKAARTTIADSDYSVAKAKCGSKAGNDKDVCIKEAKAAHVAAIADAKADKKVSDARTDAKDDKTDANYKVATEKCDALAGAAKDSCVADAKQKYGK